MAKAKSTKKIFVTGIGAFRWHQTDQKHTRNMNVISVTATTTTTTTTTATTTTTTTTKPTRKEEEIIAISYINNKDMIKPRRAKFAHRKDK